MTFHGTNCHVKYSANDIIHIGVDDMNWLQEISKSIDYIEDNLTDPLDADTIAKVSSTSPFYYQRMFMVLTNMSLQEYIRNRRLTLAAQELLSSDIKIIDLALKYQYDSSESFSRAFKKIHGKSPATLRKDGSSIKAFLKLTIQVNLKGDIPMNYRLETKDSFSYYGMTKTFSTIDGANFKEIPLFWQDTMKDGSFDNMMKHGSDDKCLGVCQPMNPETDTEFDYVIGGFSTDKIEGYDYFEVPGHEWAVFELKGPISETIQSTWKRIFSEWFPQTGYKHADLPELEVYFGGDVNSSDYYMEIWIPIIK